MSRNVYNFSDVQDTIFFYSVLTLMSTKGMLGKEGPVETIWRRGCREIFRGYKYLKSLPFLQSISRSHKTRPVLCSFFSFKSTSVRGIIMVAISKLIIMMKKIDLYKFGADPSNKDIYLRLLY